MSQPPFDDVDLHGFVDGQIKPERAAALSRWLETQPSLRRRVDLWKRQKEGLKLLFAGVVLEPVPARLGAATLCSAPVTGVRAEPGRQTRPQIVAARSVAAEPPPQTRTTVRFACGAALAVLIGVVGAVGAAQSGLSAKLGFRPRVPDVTVANGRALPTRAAEAHQTFATDLNRPVEIPASDEGRLLKWIQHRLAMPIRIPDLRAQGWSLLGGRIVPGELGPAAFLLYGNGVERLGLYVARTNATATDGFMISETGPGPGSVASWVDEPFGYALTTSRDSNWLMRNGSALYGSVRAQARDTASAF